MTTRDSLRIVLRSTLLLACVATLPIAMADAVPLSARQAIETRKERFNDIGWATKAINDQLKTRSPDLSRMTAAAATIAKLTPEIVHWFPVGSGRESGADTDALPAVWKERADFDALSQKLIKESQQLTTTLKSNDFGAIRTQFTALREVCSSCHRRYLAKR